MRRASGLIVSEAEFTTAVIQLAKYRGWKVAHFRPAQMRSGKWATAMQGDKGFPDLALARNREVIFAELKTETGRLSREQKEWGENLPYFYVWRPSDLRTTIPEILR